jgi:altronate dehydratase small subunit
MTLTAIAITARDSVAVTLRDVFPGETVTVRIEGRNETLIAADAIPLGHKIALRPLSAGTPVIKYGEVIASTTSAIAAGQHVHVHNIASNRAR